MQQPVSFQSLSPSEVNDGMPTESKHNSNQLIRQQFAVIHEAGNFMPGNVLHMETRKKSYPDV